MNTIEFDYIIIGGGAAGSVLASRLSADPNIKVLLLEAGPDYPPGFEPPQMLDPYPIALSYPAFSWSNLTAEVGADLGDGKPRLSRKYLQGYGIGGGSNIQGMVATRGYPQDYDQWRDSGAVGWGWEDVLPYFRRLEHDLDFDGPLHGKDGPIPVRRIKPEDWAPFSKAMAESALDLGYPLVEDFNADFRAGVAPLPMANYPERRVSAAMGYLTAEVRRRPGLAILAEAHVEYLRVLNGKVTEVVCKVAGEIRRLRSREIIVAAGALHSPAILLRSGIGPADHLRQMGIEVAHDIPGVGQNLMNHVSMSIAAHLPRCAVQSSQQRGFGQNCVRLSSGVDGPENDLLLFSINKTAWHALGRRIGAIGVEVEKTDSRGEVRLQSAQPSVPPSVKFNLLSDERDIARVISGISLCLKMLTTSRMKSITNDIFLPNARLVAGLGQQTHWNRVRASIMEQTLEVGVLRRMLLGKSKIDPRKLLSEPMALRELVLERASPPHHVSGTCRMGSLDDKASVVDPDCRARGIENLRVIDASIMPNLVRANTHISILMIAERMADAISRGEGRRARPA